MSIHRLKRAALAAGFVLSAACDRSTTPDPPPASITSVALRPSGETPSAGELTGAPARPAPRWDEALATFPAPSDRVERDEQAWRAALVPEAFEILRREGTEPAFSSPLLEEARPGLFVCGACGNPLFASETKFKSGTGWPSFYRPVQEGRVAIEIDRSYGMVRKEVECARCDSHLGHVFDDGPEPTGLRYCINGLALDFTPVSELPTAAAVTP